MASLDRRRFLSLLGGGLVGAAGVALVGCSNGSDIAAPTSAAGGGVLDGVSLDIRRDPG